MTRMGRADVAYIAAISIMAVSINPFLKSIGLLPADVFRSYGILYPGLPQIVFGPLMAFLLLVCYVKTGQPLIFPIIGTVRALALGFLFPANMAHLGTGLAGILAGLLAARFVKNGPMKLTAWLPLLAGLYAGSYAAGNYITTLLLGPAADVRIITLSPHLAIGVVAGSLALGVLAGLGVYRIMQLLHPGSAALASGSHGVA